MELSSDTAALYLRRAFADMGDLARRLGEPRINERPLGTRANSVAALIIHCCAVTEFWMGHVGLGRPSTRDRDLEFSGVASLPELDILIASTLARAEADLGLYDAGRGTDDGGRQFLPGGDTSDAAVVLHVIEELFQHLGHMELTADVVSDR